MIVIVFGLPGSGKSYFAERLAKVIGAHHISSDVIRKQFYSKPTYSKEEKIKIYKKMFDVMYDYVYRIEHLILDGTFYKASIRNVFIEQVQFFNKEIKFIELKANEPLIKQRISKYRKSSEANYDIYKLIKKEFEPYNREHLVLQSTNSNMDDMIKSTLSYLELQTEELDIMN